MSHDDPRVKRQLLSTDAQFDHRLETDRCKPKLIFLFVFLIRFFFRAQEQVFRSTFPIDPVAFTTIASFIKPADLASVSRTASSLRNAAAPAWWALLKSQFPRVNFRDIPGAADASASQAFCLMSNFPCDTCHASLSR